MAVAQQPQFSGLVTNPTLSVRLNNATSAIDMGVSALLDAAFGSVQGQTLYRGAVGWSTSAATGPFAINLTKSGTLAVATDVDLWKFVPSAMAISFAYMAVKTPSVGATIIVDILVSNNGGSSFASLWPTNPGNRPRVTAGNNVGALAIPDTLSIGPTNTLPAILRLDIIQVGSGGTEGSDLTVILFGDAAQ